MLFIIKMIILGAIFGGVLKIIKGLINTIVKNDEMANMLNQYVTAIGWLIVIYLTIF